MGTEQKKDPQSPSACPVESLPLDKLSLKVDKVDRLSQLPPELIRAIFRLVYVEEDAPVEPLSKTLAPFHYEHTLHTVIVERYKGLKKLMRIVLQRPELGLYVKRLAVMVAPEDEDMAREQKKKKIWTLADSKALVRFLSKLTNLNALALDGARRVVDIVLKPSLAAKYLQNLKTLDLELQHIPGVKRSFDPQRYTALAHYPLTRLSLSIEEPVTSPALSSPIPPSICEHFGRLVALDLGGTQLDAESATVILKACKSLKELVLDDGSGEVDFPSLLEALPCPDHLCSLDLTSNNLQGDAVPLRDILPFLRRCAQLKNLGLTGSFLVSPSLLAALKDLPLVSLTLGADTPVSPDDLLDFLCPSSRPSSLVILHLSNIFALRGEMTDPDDPADVWLDDDGEPELPPGWELPRWKHGWTPEVVETVETMAMDAGLVLLGTTFEAAEIEEDFEAEELKVEDYWELMGEMAEEMDCCGGWEHEGYEDEEGSENDDDEEDDEEKSCT